MGRKTRGRIAAVGLAPLLVFGVACSSDNPGGQAEAPLRVAIAADVPPRLLIGVIVSTQGPGAEVLAQAEGARVAEYRINGLDPSRKRMELVVADDLGSRDEAVTVVEDLSKKAVAGIVYASRGAHMEAAIRRAGELKIPLLLPYEPDTRVAEGADNVWFTGPTAPAIGRALARYAAAAKLRSLVLVTDPAYQPGGLKELEADDADVVELGTAVEDYDERLEAALSAEGRRTVDAVVIWGPAGLAAEAVGAVQRRDLALPVLVSDALRPSFGAGLQRLERNRGRASTDGMFLTAGPAVTDVDHDPAVDAFLQALRIAAADERVTDLFGGTGLGAGEGTGPAAIDTAAHDAVLVLTAAAVTAGSTERESVMAAIAGLDSADIEGLAGPAPRLSSRIALKDDAIIMLQAEAGMSGARIGVPGPPVLGWVRAEAGKAGR